MTRKTTGAERGALDADELPPHLVQLARLDADLAVAFDAAPCPTLRHRSTRWMISWCAPVWSWAAMTELSFWEAT